MRGNLVLAEHGRLENDGKNWASGNPFTPTIGPGRRRTIALSVPGLTFADAVSTSDSAQSVLTQRDPRRATPAIVRMQSWPERGSKEDPKLRAEELPALDWKIQADLFQSGPDDPHATVEVDDQGTAILRFGNGVNGRIPTGRGIRDRPIVSATARPATSATDRIVQVRSLAAPGRRATHCPPAAAPTGRTYSKSSCSRRPPSRPTLLRAITPEDYAKLAQQLEPEVQRAICSIVPSGGRQVARIALDRFGSDEPDEILQRRVALALEPFRRVGHDGVVVNVEYVPLLMIMRVELLANYTQVHLRMALRAALGVGVLPDGSPCCIPSR